MVSAILETAFNNCFFEVTVEAQHLFVKLDKSGLELLVHVATEVVHILSLGKRLAHFIFFLTEVTCWWLGHSVERHLDVVSIAVLFQLNVTDFLVAHDGGVVSWDISWEFGEI